MCFGKREKDSGTVELLPQSLKLLTVAGLLSFEVLQTAGVSGSFIDGIPVQKKRLELQWQQVSYSTGGTAVVALKSFQKECLAT